MRNVALLRPINRCGEYRKTLTTFSCHGASAIFAVFPLFAPSKRSTYLATKSEPTLYLTSINMVRHSALEVEICLTRQLTRGRPESEIFMTTTTPTPDVPLPPGVVEAYWQDLNYSGSAFRYFKGRRRVIDHHRDVRFVTPAVEVHMAGTQDPDGTIDERYVVVHQLHADYPITAAQARQLARVLIAVADEVDRLKRPE